MIPRTPNTFYDMLDQGDLQIKLSIGKTMVVSAYGNQSSLQEAHSKRFNSQGPHGDQVIAWAPAERGWVSFRLTNVVECQRANTQNQLLQE